MRKRRLGGREPVNKAQAPLTRALQATATANLVPPCLISRREAGGMLGAEPCLEEGG